jgi:isoleucyl-tRNA synthetase
VRFPLTSLPEGASPELVGADLLVWTTTPWTLVSNTAVAVHPEVTYVVARRPSDNAMEDDRVVVAEALMPNLLGEGWYVAARFPGSELLGSTYDRPLDLIEIPDAHVVVPGSFVTTEDGTGLAAVSVDGSPGSKLVASTSAAITGACSVSAAASSESLLGLRFWLRRA